MRDQINKLLTTIDGYAQDRINDENINKPKGVKTNEESSSKIFFLVCFLTHSQKHCFCVKHTLLFYSQ